MRTDEWYPKRLFRLLCQRMGELLGRLLSQQDAGPAGPVSAGQSAGWWEQIQPGDVLLVETCSRVGTAIKYLTQSTWSHAALFVGDRCGEGPLVEADLTQGVIASPIKKYLGHNTRICRPVGLGGDELSRVLDFAIARLGHKYDLRNIFDLARYLLPTPPVPTRWRRRLLVFGSGEPTKAICSGLIAQAFQEVRYPVLPVAWWSSEDPKDRYLCYQIRHYSTFTPRDFDISPYFEVVKPTIRRGFDYRLFQWIDRLPNSEKSPFGSYGRD